MTESEQLAAFAAAVRDSTLKRLRQVPPGWESWRPAPGAMSIADIARHLLEADAWLDRQLAEGGQPPLEGHASTGRAAFDRLLGDLESAGQRRCDLLRSYTPERLQSRIHDDRYGGEVSAWWVIVRGNLDHEIHHRGQIAAALAQIKGMASPSEPTALRAIHNCIVYPDRLAAAGQPTEQQFSAIAAAGYEVVVNLIQPEAPAHVASERAVVEALGMEYVSTPVALNDPRPADLQAFMAAMERLAGRRIFVHCSKGICTSVFVALYRVLRLGWTPERATREIYRIWVPDPVWEYFIEEALA
jgi:protein tyrosine phosphatase (PTP) superfamily phosphohydrolase (DUF442 family)/uncharacterized damage-inducible protein DinB